MATITSIKARQIFDSLGNPTVEVDVHLSNKLWTRAAVPSGASTVIYEALELRDGGSDYLEKGVRRPLAMLTPSLALFSLAGIQQIRLVYITSWFNNLMELRMSGGGVNRSLVQMPSWLYLLPCAKLELLFLIFPRTSTFLTWLVTRSWYCLFLPSMSSMVDHTLGKTCYVGAYQASSFKEAMKMGVEVYHNLKVVIGMDVAASEFYGSEKTYDLNFKEEISRDQLKDLYKPFIFGYPIVSIEDPFDQDDWEHYAKLTGEIGAEVQIVGDDLLVTNPKRVKKAIKEKTCNALPLKVNQIGSVTESIEAVKMSKRAGWGVMASHHSGETEDTFIADLSVGLATGQIKTGAPCRSERLAKYNQLLRIEEELGSEAVYAEAKFRVPVEPY
ncbi:enolase-like isoform X2 [Olea europaea var. sylvestris]|uniref:enolase-like isoform X2 n=1 Tax=Olea europaea var. sylvestris TaxID=158386 RepID=UPI000C1D7E7E|nr:enolase-like isoform X2 [Olea europaea var. sylvestris]